MLFSFHKIQVSSKAPSSYHAGKNKTKGLKLHRYDYHTKFETSRCKNRWVMLILVYTLPGSKTGAKMLGRQVRLLTGRFCLSYLCTAEGMSYVQCAS